MSTLARAFKWLDDHVTMACWPVIATLFVQVDVLGNHFIFDDYLHLYKMSNGPFHYTVLATHGGHLLTSFNTMVWLLQNFVGANAGVYFLVALTIHLASVRLLFEVVARSTGKPALAVFGAALWGMCPFAEGSVGWMSVNGHVYLTAAILWVLLDIVKFSQDPSRLTRGLLARDYLLLLIAATSFGTGFAAALGFGLVVAIWDPLPSKRIRVNAVYGSVTLAVVILYFATVTLRGEPGGGQGVVDIVSRNLGNWPKILALFGELSAVGAGGLVLGPVLVGEIAAVSNEMTLQIATCAAIVVAAVLAWGAWSANPGLRRQLLGLLVLACIGYAMIAFARYWAVDGASQLIRYHYLPPAVLTIMLCLAAAAIADRYSKGMQHGKAIVAVWLALVIVPYAMATRGMNDLMEYEQYAQFEQARVEIRRALDNATDAFEVLIPNRPYFVRFFGGAPEDFPGLAAFFVMTYPSNVVDGRRVFFLAEDQKTESMARAQKGSRIAELLIYRPTARRPPEKSPNAH